MCNSVKVFEILLFSRFGEFFFLRPFSSMTIMHVSFCEFLHVILLCFLLGFVELLYDWLNEVL